MCLQVLSYCIVVQRLTVACGLTLWFSALSRCEAAKIFLLCTCSLIGFIFLKGLTDSQFKPMESALEKSQCCYWLCPLLRESEIYRPGKGLVMT